jgi:hypothetical protein
LFQADLFDLFLDADDDDLKKTLPSGPSQTLGEMKGHDFRTDGKYDHQSPREDDGSVDFNEPMLKKDQLIGAKTHDRPPEIRRLVFRKPG